MHNLPAAMLFSPFLNSELTAAVVPCLLALSKRCQRSLIDTGGSEARGAEIKTEGKKFLGVYYTVRSVRAA